MARIYRKTNPHLFDVAIDEIQSSLAKNIEWLDTIFGRCERLVKIIDGRKYYSANWYDKGNDYILVAPDEQLGNFVFFALDEPSNLDDYAQGDTTLCKVGFSIIIWCDLRTINVGRDTEDVKEQLLQTLNGLTHLHSGRFYINRVWQKAENVFKDYDYDEIDNQFFMHPFAGFRIEGELEVDTACLQIIPPTPPVEKPYIKGHLFEYEPTFSFVVNNGETIQVNVDKNGWWKWEADRIVTSLRAAFSNNITLDAIEFYKLAECTDARLAFSNCTSLASILIKESFENCTDFYALTSGCSAPKDIIFVNANINKITSGWRAFIYAKKIEGLEGSTFENVESAYQMFFNYSGKKLHLDSAKFSSITSTSGMFSGASRLEDFRLSEMKLSFSLAGAPNLSKDSVLSCINAAIANINISLNSSVYAKCEAGGEWNIDIQAAIDAKAAQGYTVTLISA